MAREYTHIKVMEKEIFEMKNAGKTNREIAEHFGFKDKHVVKRLVTRHNHQEELVKSGVLPRRRGRPSKGYQPTEKEKENEIKRLRMENKLLRDFLRLAGRK